MNVPSQLSLAILMIQPRGLRAIGHAQFLENVLQMKLDRVLADRKSLGDLRVRQTFGHQGQVLALSLGEIVQGIRRY